MTKPEIGSTIKKPWEELDNDLEENTVPASEEQSREVNEALGLQTSSMTWEDNREDNRED